MITSAHAMEEKILVGNWNYDSWDEPLEVIPFYLSISEHCNVSRVSMVAAASAKDSTTKPTAELSSCVAPSVQSQCHGQHEHADQQQENRQPPNPDTSAPRHPSVTPTVDTALLCTTHYAVNSR